MTTRQAEQQGLIFTGISERSFRKDRAKECAAEIRKKYNCRAVLVSECNGVSVYADKKYEDMQRVERLETILKLIPNKKEALLKQLAELEEEEKATAKEIEELKNLYK